MSLYPLTLVFISLFAHLFRFESPLFHAAPHEIFGDCQLYSNFVATCVVFVRCLALSHAPPPPCLSLVWVSVCCVLLLLLLFECCVNTLCSAEKTPLLLPLAVTDSCNVCYNILLRVVSPPLPCHPHSSLLLVLLFVLSLTCALVCPCCGLNDD